MSADNHKTALHEKLTALGVSEKEAEDIAEKLARMARDLAAITAKTDVEILCDLEAAVIHATVEKRSFEIFARHLDVEA